MKKFDFLVCYDIANAKRLAKVARVLQKVAIRIQKSQFFYMDAKEEDINILIEQLEQIIHEKEDDVRIYKVDVNHSLHLESGIDLKQPNIL